MIFKCNKSFHKHLSNICMHLCKNNTYTHKHTYIFLSNKINHEVYCLQNAGFSVKFHETFRKLVKI